MANKIDRVEIAKAEFFKAARKLDNATFDKCNHREFLARKEAADNAYNEYLAVARGAGKIAPTAAQKRANALFGSK